MKDTIKSIIEIGSFCLLVCIIGCQVESRPPTGGGGTCNRNQQCEAELGEDCIVCQEDCPCCNAVEVNFADIVKDDKNALGKADGKYAQLNENSIIQLTIGREIISSAGEDFQIVGKVQSASKVELNSNHCIEQAPDEGAFLIEMSEIGEYWQDVGYWGQTYSGSTASQADVATFSLKCGIAQGRARFIRITGRPKAAGLLDAIVATSCSE